MREIKFRFWNAQGLRFHYDQRQVLSCLTNQICGGYDYTKDDCAFEQFTGLRDKNGREIYEGDIYKCEDEDGPQIVEYYEGYEGDSHPVQGFIFCSFFREDNVISDVEVIGNIHENPELVATA